MKSPTDVASAVFLLALCGIGTYSVSSLPGAGMEVIGPGAFPSAILFLLTILSAVLLVQGFRKAPDKKYWPEKKVLGKIGLFIGLFYLYLLSLTQLGDLFATMDNPPFEANGAFAITTSLFLLIALPLLGCRKVVRVVAVAAITTGTIVGVFSGFFQVLLP